MIEFTILLDDSELEFEPFREEPALEFMLPPTARIGREDDVVHLAPVPVHCFFNGLTFGHWLAEHHGLSDFDSFVVYMLHDMFKPLLTLKPRGKSRLWPHSREFFDHLDGGLDQLELDNPVQAFYIACNHHKRGIGWKEAVRHEGALEAGIEAPDKKRYSWDWPLISLTIRLQSALSNALSIAYVKKLFVESYTEAMRAEYPDVFARFDAISYEYEFVDAATLTGDTDKDIESLCRQSRVYLDDGRLVIRTFIGAHGPYWKPDQRTRVCLPFWLLLTLREDPISILFPVPTLYGSDGEPADNPAFLDRVRDGFHRRVCDLLTSVKVSKAKHAKWAVRVDEIMAAIDETFHIESGSFERVQSVREPIAPDAQCALCGSHIPKSFVCLPVQDLGWNPGRYTDWHIGDAGSVCLLCAISHFKVPPEFAMAKKLVWQRQLVFFSISTPHATGESLLDSTPKADLLPFFSADIKPQLVISSLESLVTLNLVGALFLHSAIKAAEVRRDGERDLWLERAIELNPFSFVGQVQRAHTLRALPELLRRMRDALGRAVIITDPLMFIRVEVPFHTLACVVGAKSGRHYELKFKPLLVSNEMGTLPVVHDGYHFIDQAAVNAIEEVQRFLGRFRSPKVSDRMKVTAVAADPREFTAVMVELGGFNYGTVHERLVELANGGNAYEYLKHLRMLVMQYPIIRELFQERRR